MKISVKPLELDNRAIPLHTHTHTRDIPYLVELSDSNSPLLFISAQRVLNTYCASSAAFSASSRARATKRLTRILRPSSYSEEIVATILERVNIFEKNTTWLLKYQRKGNLTLALHSSSKSSSSTHSFSFALTWKCIRRGMKLSSEFDAIRVNRGMPTNKITKTHLFPIFH